MMSKIFFSLICFKFSKFFQLEFTKNPSSANTWEPRANLNFSPRLKNRKNANKKHAKQKQVSKKQKKLDGNENIVNSVEQVLSKRENKGKIEYLIKWTGYDK